MVDIFPLLKNGEIPGQEILDLVLAVCNADTVRPMTDLVTVLPPCAVEFELDVTWYLERKNASMASAISAAVGKAADDWLLWQRSALGRDINPSELVRRMMEAGAKRIIVNSPDFCALEFNQLGIALEINVYYGGVEDG
jgi:phage-related baseplate assembly protein